MPAERIDVSRPGEGTRATGGSTAEPITIPCWRTEAAVAGNAAWLARSWIGIAPDDRLFLLWGHSHLFGTGWRATGRRLRRKATDVALGYYRWSAYDLSLDALRHAADRMLRFRPQYVVGYSVAIDRFAEANQDRAADLRRLNLKAVVATAEGFPRPDSRAAIRDVFDCPVLMEYGTVESGVLAHEVSDDNYRVLWQTHLLEALPAKHADSHPALLITSLYPRKLPLIRYHLGDHITGADENIPLVSFRSVAGRCNDVLTLPSGQLIHSEAIAHIVRDFSSVRGYQIIYKTGDYIRLQLLTSSELEATSRNAIRQRLSKLTDELSNVELLEVDKLQQSVSGKTPTIIHLPAL